MVAYVFLSDRQLQNQSKAKSAASINNIDKNNPHLTMVPAEKQNHCDDYVGHGDTTTYTGNLPLMHLTSWYDYGSKTSLEVELMIGDRMTEEESKSCSIDESRSSSKEEDIIRKDTRDDHDDNMWLQLGLGGYHASGNITPNLIHLDRIEPTTRNGTVGLLELDLSLSAGATSTTKHYLNPIPTSISNTPFILQQQQQQPKTSFSLHQQEVLTWGSSYRPNSWLNQNIPSSSSSSLPPPMLNNYYLQRLIHQHQPVLEEGGPSSSSVISAVVDPPRRPHSGVWIVLQASQAQDREPFLPQIPKNYLRIKDGRTTVRLLAKYLVNKLRLNSESEIEIRCRGQQLVPFLTLQHVRDYIWINNNNSRRRRRRRNTTTITDDDGDDNSHLYYNYDNAAPMTLLPNNSVTTSTEKHLMILNYARCEGGDNPIPTTTTN